MDYNFREDRSQHKHFSCVSLSYGVIGEKTANNSTHQMHTQDPVKYLWWNIFRR